MPEPEPPAPDITVASFRKPAEDWAVGLAERIMGMPALMGDDAESRRRNPHDDIAMPNALGDPGVRQGAQR